MYFSKNKISCIKSNRTKNKTKNYCFSSVKWEGGAGIDPRYQQMDGQLTITNVDKNRDKGGWTCSVLTPGGELARREVC